MKVAFVVFALAACLVVYVSAQETAPNSYLARFKKLRRMVIGVQKLKQVENKVKSWKERKSCLPDDMASLPQRLLDWFHVLKSMDLRKHKDRPYQAHETLRDNDGCLSPALVWFFETFDSDKDMKLSERELGEIETTYEHCLKQFFQKCDLNKDQYLSMRETCRCFTTEPPCSQEIKEHKRTLGEYKLGEYKPKCDEDGFYAPRQCHERYCWCVDRFNQKVEGTNGFQDMDCPDNTDPNEELFTGNDEFEE